jgi:hypothetical protein
VDFVVKLTPCTSDADCNNNGQCITTTITKFNDRTFNKCECNAGFVGMKCERIQCVTPSLNCGTGNCTQSITDPASQRCMCPRGYFGANCENQTKHN